MAWRHFFQDVAGRGALAWVVCNKQRQHDGYDLLADTTHQALSLSTYLYIYIHIYRERERERDTMMGNISAQIIPIMLPLFVADHQSQSPSPGLSGAMPSKPVARHSPNVSHALVRCGDSIHIVANLEALSRMRKYLYGSM